MITYSGIAKRYGRLRVLRGVDLEIARGRVLALVGPNGAGKTTLIKLLLGLARSDEGTITVDGQPIGAEAGHRARIGYMPQLPRFPENLSAAELFAMLRDLRGRETPVDEELVDALSLGEHLDKPLRTLSGGTRQKVNAVIAFMFRPGILVLDEPSAGMDPVASSILKDRILAERGAGKTVLLTSHVMSELEELADDVAFLLDGKVSYNGPVYDLKRTTRQLNLERAIATLMTREVA